MNMKVRVSFGPPQLVVLYYSIVWFYILQYFQLFLSLAVVVASVSAAPRYIVLPIEDVDLSVLMGQTLPVYRMPGLTRQARQVDQPESRDTQPAASSGYSAPAGPAGPDHVDYGAYTGGYGAFGWYTDHPVLLGPGH